MTQRGLVWIEALTSLVVLVIAAAVVLTALKPNRAAASLQESLANLKQYGTGMSSYAADYNDRLFSFSWRAGSTLPSTFPDLQGPVASDLEAAARQAIDIMRRRANRTDIPVISNWIPHILFSHLVLVDYLDGALPARWVISPEDKRRITWANDPAGFDQGRYQPQPSPDAINRRWPYSSSYEVSVNLWSADSGNNAVATSTSHNTFIITSATVPLGNRTMSEIVNPAHKAVVWDQHSRHSGDRVAFFMFAEARVPNLLSDGSAHVRGGAAANQGWNPQSPTVQLPLQVTYSPALWDPQTNANQSAPCRQRHTRNGLAGVDFDRKE